jgi:hypothetical protein
VSVEKASFGTESPFLEGNYVWSGNSKSGDLIRLKLGSCWDLVDPELMVT